MREQPAGQEQLARVEARIDTWLARRRDDTPSVAAVDRGEPGERRWYVRLSGEEKGTFTVWLTLGQRTLQHETYVMPGPIENEGGLYEHLLRRNRGLHGVAFAIGAEEAVFLVGQVPVDEVDEVTLDWLFGTVYATVERCFRPAMRIGYASVFKG